MSGSVESTVSVALALQNQATLQQKNNLLLRKALDNQAGTIANLIQSVPSANELASIGSVGTRVHVTA